MNNRDNTVGLGILGILIILVLLPKAAVLFQVICPELNIEKIQSEKSGIGAGCICPSPLEKKLSAILFFSVWEQQQ